MTHRRRAGGVSRRAFLRDSTIAVAALLGCRRSSGTMTAAAATGPDAVVDVLVREIPRLMSSADIPGLSIALVRDGTVSWAQGFGFTDRSRKTPVTAETPFFVGSITKSFTALGVLRAVSRGLMSLDAPLTQYLPWFTVRAAPGGGDANAITVRHLLSHHSGLGTWAPIGSPYDDQYHERSFEQVVRSTRDSRLKFAPGARFEYSNQGIDLAGFALQEVAGRPLEQFLLHEVFRPLAMTASTLDPTVVKAAGGVATPYERSYAIPVRNGTLHPLRAAGGMTSTAADLARFIGFHLRGRLDDGTSLVDAAALREMYSPQLTAAGLPTGYGLGVYNALEWSTPRLSHGGLGYGVSTHYRWLPEHALGVVVLTSQGAAHNAPHIAGRAVELMLGSKLGRPPEPSPIPDAPIVPAPVDPSALRRLEGTYLLYERILARFEVRRGQLVQVEGRVRHPLVPRSATEFTSGARRYAFLLGSSGRVTGVRIEDPAYDPSTAENSVLLLAVDSAPADPPGPAKPEWSMYRGRYVGTFIGQRTEVRVSVERGYLTLDGVVRLAEEGEGRFLTADRESVIFGPRGELSVGNRYYRQRL